MIQLPINIDYSGKVVVVTGAGGLICGAMARAFAQSGAKVAALDLNEDAVKKLADELKAEGFVCEGYQANVLDPEALEKVYKAYHCFSAPVVLIICGDTAAACDSPTTERNMAETDASIVATHMMLEAVELGLGCTYVCAFKAETVRREFDLPENVVPYSMLPIGYPAEDCVPSERHFRRLPLSETVKFV